MSIPAKSPRSEGSAVRQLVWYFAGLLVAYVAALVIFWPPAGEDPNQAIFYLLMFAPTFGAVLAQMFGVVAALWHTRTKVHSAPIPA
jgi:predicted outer membrane lipoprotein